MISCFRPDNYAIRAFWRRFIASKSGYGNVGAGSERGFLAIRSQPLRLLNQLLVIHTRPVHLILHRVNLPHPQGTTVQGSGAFPRLACAGYEKTKEGLS